MVWFQCEDCGDNLKKPKLPNHFRSCSASRLSCIDCGEVFGRQTVEGHTQCITEAEKYGPKGQAKATNGTKAKPNNDSNQKPDFDINVGLSERPPWFCSLCNTKATSKQTLQLHAEGKKHKAKVRGFHAKQQPRETEETNNGSIDKKDNGTSGAGQVEQNPSRPDTTDNISVAENGDLQSSKKRKLETAEKDGRKEDAGGDTCSKLGNGEVIQVEKANTGKKSNHVKKAKHSVDEDQKAVDSSSDKRGKKIKWKKLITSALKSNPNGTLKIKKLNKLVQKALKESGSAEDENQITNAIEKKINSSSRFTVDGKCVSLSAKS